MSLSSKCVRLFIHSLKYLLPSYSVLGIVLSAGDAIHFIPFHNYLLKY